MSNRKAHKKLEERIERLVREFEDATGEEVRDLGRPGISTLPAIGSTGQCG